MKGELDIPEISACDFWDIKEYLREAYPNNGTHPNGNDWYCPIPDGKGHVLSLEYGKKIFRLICGSHMSIEVINKFIDFCKKNGYFVGDTRLSPSTVHDKNLYEAQILYCQNTANDYKVRFKECLLPKLRELGFKGTYPNYELKVPARNFLHFQGYSSGGAVRVTPHFREKIGIKDLERLGILFPDKFSDTAKLASTSTDYWFYYDFYDLTKILQDIYEFVLYEIWMSATSNKSSNSDAVGARS